MLTNKKGLQMCNVAKRAIIEWTIAFDKGVECAIVKASGVYGGPTTWVPTYVPLLSVSLYVPLFKDRIQSSHCEAIIKENQNQKSRFI